MIQPATYSMISILLVSLICYFIYIYNVKYDETKEIMEKRIQNLTINYHQRRDATEQVFQQRLKNLKNQLQAIMTEKQYEMTNLDNSYEREKYLMNSTAYILYAMHVPQNLIPGEIGINPHNFLRHIVNSYDS